MNAKSLTVVAQVKARPGKEAELRHELLALVGPSRKDAGCVNYDLHEAVDKAGSFFLHENWASKSHLDAHLQQPHVQAFLAKLGQLTAEPPPITLWERIA